MDDFRWRSIKHYTTEATFQATIKSQLPKNTSNQKVFSMVVFVYYLPVFFLRILFLYNPLTSPSKGMPHKLIGLTRVVKWNPLVLLKKTSFQMLLTVLYSNPANIHATNSLDGWLWRVVAQAPHNRNDFYDRERLNYQRT